MVWLRLLLELFRLLLYDMMKIAEVLHFPTKIREILLPLCETECGLNRLEMFKRPLRFLELDRHILFRPLQLVIPVKVVLCILRGRECRIERNPDLFICIVILKIKMILAAFQRIPIGMQKLAIYAIFVLPLCAFQLLFLEHQLL